MTTVNGYKIEPYAKLNGADLSEADLWRVSLYKADLSWTNLSEADLREADLSWADLYRADLSRANLREADLRKADLSEANLRETNLSEADLSWTDLSWTDLREANLSEANLRGANLSGAILPDFQLPEGDLVGYKKVKDSRGNRYVIKLLVPKEAKRTACLTSNKCRAEFVKVIGVPDKRKTYWSIIKSKFSYKLDEIIYPNSFNDDIRISCTNGIHFFKTKEEAQEFMT